MSTTEMDTDFASAVRAELTAIGTTRSHLQRHQRRTRALAIGVGALALAGTTTGAALIVSGLPGVTTVGPLGHSVTVTHTGTGSIDLGPAPENAAVVVIDLTCVSDSGQVAYLTVPEEDAGGTGGGAFCDVVRDTMHIPNGMLPPAGSTSITITAQPGTTWTASAQYGTSTSSAWGINANGQTYGLPNSQGTPDLQAVWTVDGERGYVYPDEYSQGDVDRPVNIYKSDGTTVIDQMVTEIVPNIPVGMSRIPLSPVDPSSPTG